MTIPYSALNSNTKYIFVTGGVVSGLGKGITAASIGLILKTNGYRVDAIKFDPYLNVDPGTMSPYEHGEVFVLGDGTECDLDLGHYERFLDTDLTNISSVTAGKIYSNILEGERRGDYLGKNVQLIPHVTNYIKERFTRDNNKIDVRIIEIGGSAGDMEGEIFMEAIRQFRQHNRGQVLHFHLGYVPFLECSGEYKTKPFQNSLRELLRTGLQPHILVARYEKKPEHDISKEQLDKLALFGNVEPECIIAVPDLESIYAVPSHFYNSEVMKRLEEFVGPHPASPSGEEQKTQNSRHLERSERSHGINQDGSKAYNQTKYLIFDFDGVLARSLDDNWETVSQESFFGSIGKTREEYNEHIKRKFSKTEHSKINKLNELEYKEKLEWTLTASNLIAKYKTNAFKGFIQNIKQIKNAKLAVVSSGGGAYITKICKEIEAEFGVKFDLILTCEDSLYKDDKIQTVADNWNVKVQDCYYFTDTISDVVELQDFMDKTKIIGCSWGWLGFDLLKTILPENQILIGFDDILGYDFEPSSHSDMGSFASLKMTNTLSSDNLILNKPLPLFFKQGGKVINPSKNIKLAVVGKYGSKLGDADYSVMQSIRIAAFYAGCEVENLIIAAEDLENNIEETWDKVKSADAFLVLGGFGNRGMEGKILAAKYARENKKPFLGICLGLQMAVVEFARNVCGLEAMSAEMLESNTPKIKDFDPSGGVQSPARGGGTVGDEGIAIVIDYMKGQESIQKKGGTMRLGNYECEVVDGTLASQLFGVSKTVERHRHRLEVQTKYLEILAQNGMKVSGKFNYTSGEGKQEYLPEIMELDQNIHPYFIGIQSHPEMLSRPTKAHPLFLGLVKACLKR
jgi:CTP synthase (UTP-ammonia lyase)/FMN phosphatase YigB (HAD superfamily)